MGSVFNLYIKWKFKPSPLALLLDLHDCPWIPFQAYLRFFVIVFFDKMIYLKIEYTGGARTGLPNIRTEHKVRFLMRRQNNRLTRTSGSFKISKWDILEFRTQKCQIRSFRFLNSLDYRTLNPKIQNYQIKVY